MFNPMSLWGAQIHQTELVKRARQQKKASLAALQQGMPSRMLLWLGDRLVGAGERLRERHRPATCPDCGPYQAGL